MTYVNIVTDYGAVGDGTTDDTTAIQNALNSGAKEVYAPQCSAHYKTTADLTKPDGVKFFGTDPSATCIGTHHNSATAIKGPYNTVTDAVNYSYGGGVQDMTIRRIAGTPAGSLGLRVVNHRQSSFKNLYIDNFYNGVLVGGYALENLFEKVRVNIAFDNAWLFYQNPRHNVMLACYGATCGSASSCYYIQSGSGAPINDLSFYGCEAEAGNYTDPVDSTVYTATGNKGWRIFGDTTDVVDSVAIYSPRIDFAVGGTSYGFSQETGSRNISVRDPFYTGVTNLYQCTDPKVFSITYRGVNNQLMLESGTGTTTSNAVTINKPTGIITTGSLSTAAGGTQAITLNNSMVSSGDEVYPYWAGGTNTRPIALKSTTASGVATITIYNLSSSALNGTVIIGFAVNRAS